jgi:hypothetical protein
MLTFSFVPLNNAGNPEGGWQMEFKDFRLVAAVLGGVILASPTSAAVKPHGSAGMSAHRMGPSSHAFDQSAGRVFHRTAGGERAGVVHAGYARRYADRLGHRYGYGGAGYYGGAAVVGTYVAGEAYSDYGGGGYRYIHRSCRWYYYHEPYNTPYRCRPHGYAYSYEYGGPSNAVSYGYGHWHGHNPRLPWNGGRHAGHHPTSLVGATHIHVSHATHFAGGPRFAIPHGGGARIARIGGPPKLH